jgi:hypothetical protein
MIIEENKAGKKWCPLTAPFAALPDGGRSNCMGSGCMMWRWAGERMTHGYCGLAGLPIVQKSS